MDKKVVKSQQERIKIIKQEVPNQNYNPQLYQALADEITGADTEKFPYADDLVASVRDQPKKDKKKITFDVGHEEADEEELKFAQNQLAIREQAKTATVKAPRRCLVDSASNSVP
mmetsp:Transcript_35497/g.54306  ORF Transcript_35497/g.54306 Transcript_35497/m.54306 type:complete len:115 (+) Transcript_35497:1154-1498(+)